jgi:hypothetical protein
MRLGKGLRAGVVLAMFAAVSWAGPLASGLTGGAPTLLEWAALQPRHQALDGRCLPFSATPYFQKYHPEYFVSDPSSSASPRLTVHGSRQTDSPEGAGSARWAPVLRVAGTHCNLYVDSAASPQPNDTTCQNLANAFDTVIWTNVTTVFGTPGYAVIDIFIYPIDGAGGVGGYYSGGNDLYADSSDMSWMDEILAHEFQHLVHYSKDSNEDSWVNEGCADLAIQLCYGFQNNTTSLRSHIAYFEAYPDNDLTVFQSQLYDYGSAYAFLSYFHEHFGGNATIKALVADAANGPQGFNNRLSGTGQSFVSVFRNWTVANYLDNGSIPGGYGYENLSIKVDAVPVQDYPFALNGTVNRWAADYVSFTADGADLELVFRGQDAAPLEVWIGKVGLGGVPSAVERMVLDAARDGNITVPRLGIDYSEAVMVVSSANAAATYGFSADAVDRTAPVTTLNVTPALPDTPDGWYTRPPTLGLACSERRATTFFRWDDGADAPYTARLTAPEGDHVFRFHSSDPAGNVEPERSVPVRVDTTPPVTELSVAPPDGRGGWYVTAPEISLLSEANAATFYHWAAENETAYSGPFRPPEGYSSLTYRSVDIHGNAEANRSAEFRVDTVRPSSAILTDPAGPDGRNGWFLRAPVIRLETEPQGELFYSWDGGVESQYILPLLASEGRHELGWHAVDQAGNREENRTFSVKVDSAAPACSASLSPEIPDGSNGFYRTNVTITLRCDADATALYRLGPGGWQNYTGPFQAPEGPSTLYYYAVDDAGNRAQEQSLDLSVDTIPPVTELSMEPDAGGEWTAEAPAAALATEPRARSFWRIDGGEPRQYFGRIQLPAGRHTLWYYSVDEAGNGEAPRSRGYALDLAEPSAALWAQSVTPLTGQNVSFYGSNSTDADSGVREYRFVFGDGTESGWVAEPSATHSFAMPGVYTVSLTVRDGSGRESAPATVAVNVSAPPPPRRKAAPSPTALERLWPYMPYLLLAVAVAAVGAGAALRRKGGSRPPTGEVRWD